MRHAPFCAKLERVIGIYAIMLPLDAVFSDINNSANFSMSRKVIHYFCEHYLLWIKIFGAFKTFHFISYIGNNRNPSMIGEICQSLYNSWPLLRYVTVNTIWNTVISKRNDKKKTQISISNLLTANKLQLTNLKLLEFQIFYLTILEIKIFRHVYKYISG